MAILKNKTQRLISLRFFVSAKATKTIKLIPTIETEVSESDLKELKKNDGIVEMFKNGSIEEIKGINKVNVINKEEKSDTVKEETPAKKAGRPKKTEEIPVSED